MTITMGKKSKNPYLIGLKEFRTKKEAEAFVQSILYRYKPGQELSDEDLVFIMDLLQRHPSAEKKIGVGIRNVRVVKEVIWGTCHFEILRTDGSTTDFSFMKCLYPATRLQLFKQACRHAVAKEMVDFRHRAFDLANAEGQIICPILHTPITIHEAHVDHGPPWTFDRLVQEFIACEALDIESVELTGFGDGELRRGFADPSLAERWCQFHTTNAQLRVVSAKANLSTLKRGVA